MSMRSSVLSHRGSSPELEGFATTQVAKLLLIQDNPESPVIVVAFRTWSIIRERMRTDNQKSQCFPYVVYVKKAKMYPVKYPY